MIARPTNAPAPTPLTTNAKGPFTSLSVFSLDVQHPPHRVESRFGDRLGQGGVRVNGQIHFLDRVFVLPGNRQLVDYLRSVAANDVSSQDFAVLPVANDLHEAFSLIRGAGPAIGAEGKPSYLVVQLALLGLIFGEPDAGHLRVAVGDAGNVVVHDRLWVVPRHQLGHYDTLAAALVGQHGRAGNVADGVDACRAGLQCCRVHLNEAAVGELHAGLLEPQILGVDRAARGHEHLLRLNRLALAAALQLERHLVLGYRGLLDLDARPHLDAALLVALGECVGGFGILQGQNPRKHLDQGDLGAKGVEDVGELATNRSGADDSHGGGGLLQEERFVRTDHRALVDLESDLGYAFDPGPRGNDQCFPGLILVLAYLHCAIGAEHAAALDHSDFVLFYEKLDPLGVLLRHAARTTHRDPIVGLDASDLDTQFLRVVTHEVGDIGAVQQRLGGDAADIDAYPSELVALDYGRGESELRRPDSADITGRSAANDDHVVRICHGLPRRFRKA